MRFISMISLNDNFKQNQDFRLHIYFPDETNKNIGFGNFIGGEEFKGSQNTFNYNGALENIQNDKVIIEIKL